MIAAENLKPIFALSIFLITLAAGWYPFKKRGLKEDHVDFPIGETLATGIFLGAAFLHMLPEANNLFHEMGYRYPFAFVITGVVFLIFLWFEHLSQELYRHHDKQHPSFAILVWVVLSIHSIMLGTALGFSHHDSIIIMLFLAIITHKWAESFAIAVQLNKSSLKTGYRTALFLSFAVMTPLGMMIGSYTGSKLSTNSLLDPIIIAASAGTLLYLGTLHGLERCVMLERCCNLRHFSFVILGFTLMASVAAYV